MANIIRVGGGAGGGLAFTVVGGTTIPSSPKENTVWVKTSTAINNAYVQVFEPNNPTVGDVWVNTFNVLDADGNAIVSEQTNLTISENPFIRISAKSGKQWNGTTWVQCTIRIYKNGAWSPDVLIIFMDGNWGSLGAFDEVYVTDNLVSNPEDYISITTNGEIQLMRPTKGTYGVNAYLSNPIDVTLYNTLKVVGYGFSTSLASSGGRHGWATLHHEKKYFSRSNALDADYTTGHMMVTSNTEYVVDISSATGNMYLAIGANSSSSSYYATAFYSEISFQI